MGGWSVYRLQKQGGRQGEQKMQQDWLQLVLLRWSSLGTPHPSMSVSWPAPQELSFLLL